MELMEYAPAVPGPSSGVMTIHFSHGRKITDVLPAQCTAPDFEAFVSFLEAQRGDGASAYVCGPMSGRRNAMGAKPTRWLALDCDRISPDAFAALPGMLADEEILSYLYTTRSHTHESPRFRLVYALDREVDVKQARKVSAAMRRRIVSVLTALDYPEPHFDPCCDSPAQPLFLPSHGAHSETIPGSPVEVEALVRELTGDAVQPGHGACAVLTRGVVLDEPTVEHLRDALRWISPDERSDWIRIGLALKELGEVGRELWLEWSKRSAKFQPEDVHTWETLRPERTGYAAVFAEAQRCGWKNPMASGASDAARKPRKPVLREVDLAGLETAAVMRPKFVVAPIVPAGEVTLLGAHGGAGKTMFSLELAAHVAVGRNFGPYGVPKQASVVFVSLEDGEAVILNRLARVCKEFNLEIGAVKQNIRVVVAAEDMDSGADVQLVQEDRKTGNVVQLPALDELRSKLPQGTGLVVIDNASEAFGGNENDRRQVRTFVRCLVNVGRRVGAGVLLLAHIDKAAARYGGHGDSYSGSTAWHNSARSRLTLTPSEDGVLVTHDKLNLGMKALPHVFRWTYRGVLVPAGDVETIEENRADRDADVVLGALRRAVGDGENVSTSVSGPCTAFKVLQPYLPNHLKEKTSSERVRSALATLLMRKVIVKEQYLSDNRKKRTKFVPKSPAAAPRCAPDDVDQEE
jgi:RecA-family ATPase